MKDTLYYELSNFYWLYSSKKDYKIEAEFLDYLIKKYNPNSRNILDIGSGQGDHCFFLNSLGYDVFGVDKSEDQVNFAKNKFPNLKFQSGDFLDLEIHEKFDCVVMVWNTLLYFSPPTTLLALFSKIRNILSSEGIFIFDFKSFSSYLSHNEFKSELKRSCSKDGYSMDLITKNTIMDNGTIMESTESIVRLGDKILTRTKHNPIYLNILDLTQVIEYVKSAGLELLEVFDTNSIYKNNPSLFVSENTRDYLLVVKNSK